MMWEKKALSTIVIFIISFSIFSTITTPRYLNPHEVQGLPSGWSDDIRLTNNSGADHEPKIDTYGSEVHITWFGAIAGWPEIFYMYSIDNGLTWGSPIQITNNGISSWDPNIAVDEWGNVHIVWSEGASGDYEIYYTNSTDKGQTWSPFQNISVNHDEWCWAPKIGVSGLNIHVIWGDERHRAESFPDNVEIYYVRSIDGGNTWDDGLGNIGQDRRLTNAPFSSSKGEICVVGNTIYISWYDDRNSPTIFDVYYKRSLDNGATWDDGLGNIDQDRRLTNSTNQALQTICVNNTTIHIVWIQEIVMGLSWHLYYIKSNDNGFNWTQPQLVCDSGVCGVPSIAVSNDEVHLVWHDKRDDGTTYEIYYRNSSNAGNDWNAEQRLTYNEGNKSVVPQIEVDSSNIHVVWREERDGNREIYYKRYPDFPSDPEINITLQEGWNLVSLPLEQSNESIDQVLSSIAGKWDCIQIYDPLGPDSWKTNNINRPDSLNEIGLLNHKMGFWINITEPNVNLTVRGYIPISTSINLYAGWNLVAYPSMTTDTVANALWGTGADKVEVFDPGEPYRIREVGPSYIMRPGEGYWVHVPVDNVWVVDW